MLIRLLKNAALLEQNKMKYGVYSYSMYESPKDARYEANTLSQRAPKPPFTSMIMKNKPLHPEMMKQLHKHGQTK